MLKINAIVPVNGLPQEIKVAKKEKGSPKGPPIKFGPIPPKDKQDPNVTYIHTTPGDGSKKSGKTIVINGESFPLRRTSALESRCEKLFNDFKSRLEGPCTPNAGSGPSFSSMGVYKVVASGSGDYVRKSLV